jgi:hypothetical protein
MTARTADMVKYSFHIYPGLFSHTSVKPLAKSNTLSVLEFLNNLWGLGTE